MPVETPKILALYLQIAQYPILARQIRQRMREELYGRGVITAQNLEQEPVPQHHPRGDHDPGDEKPQEH